MNDSTKYTTDSTTLGQVMYLKHVLDKDNKVIESYACAIFNGNEYCVRGGNSSFYAENKKILDSLKISGLDCSFVDVSSICYADSIDLGAASDGSVNADTDAGTCSISAEGSSHCDSH